MIITLLTFFLFQSDSIQTVIVESSAQLFRGAFSISAAAGGRLFVIDQSTNTLNEISKDNTVAKTIGGKGWGNEEFDLPTDVASSFLLNIFVVDANNRRVQRYDKQLNYAQSYDEQVLAKLSGRFQPISAATSIQGELFILEKDGKRVIVIDQRGIFHREIGTFNETGGKLIDPKDIDISSANEVCVLDRHSVKIYDSFGNYLRIIALSPQEAWKTISISGTSMIVTSSSRIEIISINTGKRITILPGSIMGAQVTETFSDAVVQDSTLIILTPTTLYRCSFPE